MDVTAQLLGAMGLVIGAIDYAVLIRRRARDRRDREATAFAQSGLQGLVRVMAAD